MLAFEARATTLVVHVDKTEVGLGSPIAFEASVSIPDRAQPVDGITLDELAVNFDVVDISRGTRSSHGVTTQSISATLYPRHTGRLQLPPLRIAHQTSPAIEIHVRESGVVFRAGIEPNAPYERSDALLFVDVYDANDLDWSAPEPQPSVGIHTRALAESQRGETMDGRRYVVHRYAWDLVALRDGDVNIVFQSLRARKFGQRLRFIVPDLHFTARPVPAWLPVVVPLSAPAIQGEELPREMVVGRPYHWQFTVQGEGLNVNGLRQLLATTIGESPGLQTYAPVVERIEDARSKSLQQTFRVTIPMKALQQGTIELPRITLPFFDTQTERLGFVEVTGARIAVVDPLWRLAGKVLAITVVSAVVAGLAWTMAMLVRRGLRRRKFAARIARVKSALELKSILLEYIPTPPTAVGYTARNALLNRVPMEFIQRLEQACYAREPDAEILNQLKSEARQASAVS